MNIAARLARLERQVLVGWSPGVRAYAAHLAAAHGLSVDDVLREARAVIDEAAAAGALRPASRFAAFIASKEGRDPAEVIADTEAAVAAWRLGR